MTTKDDGIAIVLANRRYLYQLFQHIFGQEPNLKLMEIVTSKHTKDALQILLDDNDDKFDTYFELLAVLKQQLAANTEAMEDKLKNEYTYLLIGPGTLPAPPWESVYTTKERTLFQESTLEVRRKYLEYKFLPGNYPHEADDHIALELDFMTHLAQLTLDAFEKEQTDVMKSLLTDQKAFLENHLLRWTGDFADQIQTSKTHFLYPQTAILIDQVLTIDVAILDELIAWGPLSKSQI